MSINQFISCKNGPDQVISTVPLSLFICVLCICIRIVRLFVRSVGRVLWCSSTICDSCLRNTILIAYIFVSHWLLALLSVNGVRSIFCLLAVCLCLCCFRACHFHGSRNASNCRASIWIIYHYFPAFFRATHTGGIGWCVLSAIR